MTASGKIPFLDLVTQHTQLEEELVTVFRKALNTAAFIGGPAVEDFERDFARYCEADHAIGVSNGTDALRFALLAAGVGEGDIVVTVPNTFIATTEAISQVGAQIQFVDVDEQTSTMDPMKLQEFLETQCYTHEGGLLHRRTSKRVKAVIPVHLYGQMADMDPILDLAGRHKLIVIEDACQAHGAQYFSQRQNAWKTAGSMGRAAAFSFYPGKNLGACGEAGAVTTNDASIAKHIRMLRDHGQAKKYYHDIEGFNGRLDAIQAGFLHVKLKHLPEWTRQRQERAVHYTRLLAAAGNPVKVASEPTWSRGVYHLYVVRSERREELMAHLNAAGIGTGIHYPIPLHLQKAYKSLNYSEGDFPVSEKLAQQIVSLPMFPGLTPDQQKRVVEEVIQFVGAEREVSAKA
jgi:dTDP-4-amino-4,6-dideoxygalactose transaminase